MLVRSIELKGNVPDQEVLRIRTLEMRQLLRMQRLKRSKLNQLHHLLLRYLLVPLLRKGLV